MENSSRFAKSRLTEVSRTKQTAKFLVAGFGTAAIILVLVLAVAFLDYWLMLVPAVRYTGLAILSLFVIGGTWQIIRILRRPPALKEAALDAEAAKPEIGCELSTAAEYLSGERKASQEYENELAAALEDKAATHLTKVRLPYLQRALRPALIVIFLLIIAVIFGVVASGGLTAFQRTVFPWRNASYSQVEVLPGNVEVPVGKDLEVKSTFSGRIPRQARFQWQDEGAQEWQFAVLTRNEQGEFNYPLKNVRTSLKYRVAGSDAVSPEFKIEPYVPAEVKSWKIDVEYPSYTKLPKFTLIKPEITALRGSIASIEIAPNVKLSKAQLVFTNAAAIDLKPQPNGFWKVDVKIEKDKEFQIELADEKGRPGNSTATYAIKALPDEVPMVEIGEPGQDITAAATNTVPIKIRAMDDYGLDEIQLVYHKLGGPEQFITATRNGETNSEFTIELPLSPLGLQDYELVAYHAVARDNNTLDGPGVGKTDIFFIEITDKEGGSCKSQGKAPDKVNLLVVQKQIIADTVALTTNATPEELTQKIDDLAKRQADAIEFGRIYQKALAASTNQSAAEMTAAISAMEAAHAALQLQRTDIALPPEEKALASLYQVIRHMPELQDLPIAPPEQEEQQEQKPEEKEKKEEEKPPLLVVLEEIKKQKEEEPENQEIAEALEEAKRLQDEQASLNIGVQNTGSGGSTNGAPVETQIDRSGKNEYESKKEQLMAKADTESEPKAETKSESKSEGKGEGESQAEGKGKGQGQGKGEPEAKKEAQKKAAAKKATDKKAAAKKGANAKGGKGSKPGKGTQPGKGENPAKGGQPGENQKPGEAEKAEPLKPEENVDALAEKQSELSEEAQELAAKLERLAGKDSRLGHGIPGNMRTAASNMQKVTEALGRGDTENAGTQGAQVSATLEATIAMLEKVLYGRPDRIDASAESAPKRFEPVISEYFKALSYDN